MSTLRQRRTKEERSRFALGAIPFFLVGLVFGLGKIVRDCSLTCNLGYEFMPIAVVAIVLLATPFSAIYLQLQRRLGFVPLQLVTFIPLGLSFLALWLWSLGDGGAISAAGGDIEWKEAGVYLVFYVWLGTAGTLLGPNTKLIVYRLHGTEDRGPALSLGAAAIGGGAMMSCLVASGLVSWLRGRYGLDYVSARDSLMIPMAGLLFLVVPIALKVQRRIRDEAPKAECSTKDSGPGEERNENEPRGGFFCLLFRAIQVKALRQLGMLFVLGGLAETMLVYLFFWMISIETASEGGRTDLFARFYMYLNAATLLLLLVGSGSFVSRMGLAITLLTLPVALAIGTLVFLAHGSLGTIYGLRITEKSVEQAAYGHGLDRALLCVKGVDAARVRSMLEAMGRRIGHGTGAVVILVLTQMLSLSLTQMAGVLLFCLLTWATLVWSLRPVIKACSVKLD